MAVRPSASASRRGSATHRPVRLLLAVGLVLSACASVTTPTPATPTPAPTATPVPRLTEPVSVDDVFRRLQVDGIRIVPDNAIAGAPGEALVKRINATFDGRPATLTEFASGEALRQATGWDPARPVGSGEPPFAVVGLNILATYGPVPPDDRTPAPPDPRFGDSAEALATALEGLLGPLETRALPSVASPGADGG